MTDHEATPAPEETPATSAAPDDPETVRALARETLAGCRDNPGDPESLPKLNTVLQLVHDPSLAKEVLAAGDAVIRATVADPSPAPALHAHVTVLFALLLEYEAVRDAVDGLFAEWLRHPKSFGPAHATPPDYQREAFFQRLGDMIGWGTVDVRRDREALTRFCQWVDTWTPKNKFRARRAIDLVRRNFPAPEVWNTVHFPQGGGGGGGGHHPGDDRGRGGKGPRGGGRGEARDGRRGNPPKPATSPAPSPPASAEPAPAPAEPPPSSGEG